MRLRRIATIGLTAGCLACRGCHSPPRERARPADGPVVFDPLPFAETLRRPHAALEVYLERSAQQKQVYLLGLKRRDPRIEGVRLEIRLDDQVLFRSVAPLPLASDSLSAFPIRLTQPVATEPILFPGFDALGVRPGRKLEITRLELVHAPAPSPE